MWSDIIHGILPALTLLATGLVGSLLGVVKKRLEENTAITQTTQVQVTETKTQVTDNAEDQSKAFQMMGQMKYDLDKRFAVMEEKISHLESSNEDVKRRVERIPTVSQVAYRRPEKPEEE